MIPAIEECAKCAIEPRSFMRKTLFGLDALFIVCDKCGQKLEQDLKRTRLDAVQAWNLEQMRMRYESIRHKIEPITKVWVISKGRITKAFSSEEKANLYVLENFNRGETYTIEVLDVE